ncbi:MAG: cardiolipin synthase [Angelakisella sp.]|nr:cardiolipin synthase [Angelakisella sp.]
MKKILKLLFQRVVIVGAAIVAQVGIIALILWKFSPYFVYFYGLSIMFALGVVLYIINGRDNPGYKIAWLVPVMAFPVFGAIFYVVLGKGRMSRRQKAKIQRIQEETIKAMPKENPILERLSEENIEAGNQSRYIEKYALAPVYRHTYTEYLPMGEVKFQKMCEELEKAEHYIFLEYFIVKEGKMWDTILEILVRKAQAGVDVRMVYDDLGSIMTLPYGYDKKLESLGIQCAVFNPFVPVVNIGLNNRDHRKICIIDGHTGFTGGINLSDEYINAYPKYGHWKDSAVLMKGDAVWNLTVMFLAMWATIRDDLKEDDFENFRPLVNNPNGIPSDGYVQPFSDSPLDEEPVGETVYINLINKAKRYVHITSPYLIIDNEMVTALCNAAKSGVDVRIITPHVADKWYVHAVTRAYYEVLVESGVKIFEYTPGFIHAKTFVVDDEYAVVGTINLDYRSLYLHFECGAWMYRTRCVAQVAEDFLKTQEVCQQITLEECKNISLARRIGRSILRAFAPLM